MTTVRHGYKKAMIVKAQRVACILFQMWRKGKPCDVNQLNVVPQEKYLRTRRAYWRIDQMQEEVLRFWGRNTL